MITRSSMRNDFLRTTQVFSQYLHDLKRNRRPLPEISDESESLLKTWDNSLSKPLKFLSQGLESSSVFIIDGQIDSQINSQINSWGEFFAGESGELLKKILTAMSLSPDSVFICNCELFSAVEEKIKIISPKVIITLGEKAGQTLLNHTLPLENFRGKFYDFKGIKTMPTFHPADLIENQSLKRFVWNDMKQVMKLLGLS